MAQYMLSLHSGGAEPREPMSDADMQRSHREITALNEELRSAGAWLFAARLHPPDTATVVRMAGGEVLTTDGPFVESKEHLAGFYVLEADDLDAALAWAAKATAAIGAPIEVRPLSAGG
jgi:hypothetical protein